MTSNFTTSYAAIIKQEKQEDGTLLVYGKATDDSLDIDQQICDAAWLEKAMPEWFKTGGNIREQHSSIAAGVAKELDSKPDGHYISALVVDAQSVKKVETGVLKGFSIGIRAPRIVRDNKAANGRIIDGQIVEVSLVDRPANPNAKLMLAKSNGTEVVQMEQYIEKEEETPVATTEPTEVIEAEVVEAETAPVEAEEAKADMPSKEDALKALEDLRANLMAHEKLCKELGYLDDEDDKALEPVGESAEEETEEGSSPEAAEEEVEEAEGKKTAEGETAEEATPENSVEEAEQPALDDDVIDAIVDKAVKSATATVRDEIKSYKEEINKLQAELATAKNKAVGSGPKRAVVTKPAILEFNEFSRMAEQYRAKAADTSDNELARGYRELAAEFEAKAVALINN
jgi:pSer/pThr/pTyr-binding forkhead associated (FHA) protein